METGKIIKKIKFEKMHKKLISVFYKLLFLFSSVWLLLFCPVLAIGGPYLDSAHGNSSAGVNRSGMKVGSGLGYARGNCAHCHEQHASIQGTEPVPTGGPDNYALFYKNYDSIATPVTVCFQCHDDVGAMQTGGGIFNYSYSYRAGGWTADTVNDIREAFGLATYHNLDNILTFIQTQAWGYTANSNPCAACHNPHAAQGDPLGSSSPKSSGTRGWGPYHFQVNIITHHGTFGAIIIQHQEQATANVWTIIQQTTRPPIVTMQ